MADATVATVAVVDSKRRRSRQQKKQMKQMQGILNVERVSAKKNPSSSPPHSQKLPPMQLLLLPEQLEMRLFALDDVQCEQLVDRINLRNARLEQLQRGFLIHEESDQRFHLQDDDKQVQDAWFLAIYQAIAQTKRLTVAFTASSALKITPVSSFRDESTGSVEFELLCELQSVGFRAEQWKIWKQYAQVRALDEQLRSVLEPSRALTEIVFPRERKRDFLLGGLRKKFLQEVKQQQIALYFEKILALNGLFSRPTVRELIKEFVCFEVFFEEVTGSSSSPPLRVLLSQDQQQSDDADLEEVDAPLQESVRSDDETDTQGVVRWQDQSLVGEERVMMHPSPVNHLEATTEELQQDLQHMMTLNHRASLSSRNVPFELKGSSNSSSSNDDWSSEDETALVTDPKAAKSLHKQIIHEVSECVVHDRDRVQAFQDQTKDFGRDRMSATEYVAFLHGAVGMENCCRLLLQMVRLLPDEDKREQLLEARAVLSKRYQKRRNKTRSKQFSEGTALNNTTIPTIPIKQRSSRSKSESLVNWGIPAHQFAAASNENCSSNGNKWTSNHPLATTTTKTTPVVKQEQDESDDAASWKRPLLEHRLSIFGEDIGATDDITEETPEETAAEAEQEPPTHLHSNAANPPSQWPLRQQQQQEEEEEEKSPSQGEQQVIQSRKNISVFMQKQQESGEEVNPILQRLRKQGAVNFMLR